MNMATQKDKAYVYTPTVYLYPHDIIFADFIITGEDFLTVGSNKMDGYSYI